PLDKLYSRCYSILERGDGSSCEPSCLYHPNFLERNYDPKTRRAHFDNYNINRRNNKFERRYNLNERNFGFDEYGFERRSAEFEDEEPF
ncbi:19667_t:CDS:2, partial [Cetraspora pellucida]